MESMDREARCGDEGGRGYDAAMATGALGIEREERGEVDLGEGRRRHRERERGEWEAGSRGRGCRNLIPSSTPARGSGGSTPLFRPWSGEQKRGRATGGTGRVGRMARWAGLAASWAVWSRGGFFFCFCFVFSFIYLFFLFCFI